MNSKVAKIAAAVAAIVILVVLVGVLFSATCSGERKNDDKENVKVENAKESTEDAIKETISEKETTKKVSVNEIVGKDDETKSSETEAGGSETQSGEGEASKNETTSNNTNSNDTTTSTIKLDNSATGLEESTTSKVATENTTTKQNIAENNTTKPAATEPATTKPWDDTDITIGTSSTAQIVRDMGIGINLGNTFESCGTWINKSSVTNFETAWGSPVITKAMIQGMANEGFGVLRIPVAWSNMMDSNYNIDPSYIARVKEVVDWTLDSGMYAIVNIHYDSGWWTNFPTDKENCMKKYKAIWTQVATAFANYDERLMFESLNEEGCWDSVWNPYGGTEGKSTAYGLLNEINQVFVDVVRGSGSNNTYRHLLIAGYATDITRTCDSYFKMPTDPQGRCAVSVHYYNPFGYTHLEKDESWAKVQTEWGSTSDFAELNKYMKMMYDNFVSKGVPVIIGEFGVPTMSNKSKENVVLYLESVAEAAYNYGMCPVLWDTTNNYSYYNRYTCSMSGFSSLKEAFANILK